MTTLTTPELPPEEYYSEHCAAKLPYLLACATARWERSWPQPGHCVLSAESWSARTTGELCSRLKRPTVSNAPTFHAAQILAGGQHLRRLTDLPRDQCSAMDRGKWLSCLVRQWGRWRKTHRVPRRRGRWLHGHHGSTLNTASVHIQDLRSSGAQTGDLRSTTEVTSRSAPLRLAIVSL